MVLLVPARYTLDRLSHALYAISDHRARQQLAQGSGRESSHTAEGAAAGKVAVNGPEAKAAEAKAAGAKAAGASPAGISRHSSRALLDQLPTVQGPSSPRSSRPSSRPSSRQSGKVAVKGPEAMAAGAKAAEPRARVSPTSQTYPSDLDACDSPISPDTLRRRQSDLGLHI